VAGAAFGILAGLMGLVAGAMGADVFIVLGTLPRLTGMLAALVGLPLMPVAFGLAGMVAAILLYWPMQFVLYLLNGMRLRAR
jgi:ribosomal protein L10